MLLTVKQIKRETTDVFSVIFEKPEDLPAGRQGFNFYAGQYLDYELEVNDPDGNTRAFTISASPSEDFLMLSTKYGLTPFKKALAKLKPGDQVKTSHPVGTFILDETSPAVFIAGGIGITPFRSMIKYAYDNKLQTPITLIYSNSSEDFPFKEVLKGWRKELPNLTIIYHNSSQNGRLNNTKLATAVGYFVNNIFYLAGPPKMIDNFEKMLLELGVAKTNIRYDHFDGY